MTLTLTNVPLAKIKPREGFNPRSEFGDEQMAELVESVKQHGIITPLTLASETDGRFTIIAGERRYRAAKAAKLKEVPAQVRDGDGHALTLAVAENVIRADLNPVEEARAYERLVAEHGDTAKVAKLVGRSEKLIGERLDLLRVPDEAQALLAARKVPLACAPALIRIAEQEPLLADLAAVWLTERPQAAAAFPADPGEVIDDVLEAEWQDDDGQPLDPVAYSVGGYYGPLLPGGRNREEQVPRILRNLGEYGEAVADAYAELPEIPHDEEYDWSARQAEERRERECFALNDEDADAARAFGCLLELPGPAGARRARRCRPVAARPSPAARPSGGPAAGVLRSLPPGACKRARCRRKGVPRAPRLSPRSDRGLRARRRPGFREDEPAARAGRLRAERDRQGRRPCRLPLARPALRGLARQLWQGRHPLGAVAGRWRVRGNALPLPPRCQPHEPAALRSC
jgi:ParB/RepB/Spo0J family partition protein